MSVFAKIFSQIFDSSIASDYVVRHVFMDLLVLADRDGVVDMTLDAIARRTNVPDQIVSHAIAELMGEDGKSRSHEEAGRRLVLLDSHRDWGWQIVNYEHYRAIRDEESRKTYFRDYKRQYRESKKSTKGPQLSTLVLDSPTMSTKAEVDTEAERTITPSGSKSATGRKKAEKKKASFPTKSELRDARHLEFKNAIWNYWKSKNPALDCPWGIPEGKSLGIWLQSCPNVTIDQFKEMLRNRYRSDVTHTDRPSMWIRNLTRWANGPVDDRRFVPKTLPEKPKTIYANEVAR